MPRRTKVAWLILLPMNSSKTSLWASNWNQPDRTAPGGRAQDRQRHRVIAADRQRRRTEVADALENSWISATLRTTSSGSVGASPTSPTLHSSNA